MIPNDGGRQSIVGVGDRPMRSPCEENRFEDKDGWIAERERLGGNGRLAVVGGREWLGVPPRQQQVLPE